MAGSHVSKAPRKEGRADTQRRTQDARQFPTRAKGLLVCCFSHAKKQPRKWKWVPTYAEAQRQCQRACKVSPVFEPFQEWLLQLRGGEFRADGQSHSGSSQTWEGAAGLVASHCRSLTHTVFFIPVELVCRVALALVAAHRVHTDLLAASVVDAALVGVWGTKHAPVTAAPHWPGRRWPSLEEGAGGQSYGWNPLNKGEMLTTFRTCPWYQLTPLSTQGISLYEPRQNDLKFHSWPTTPWLGTLREGHTPLSDVRTQMLHRLPT